MTDQIEDEEVRLAMEMAMAAAQNPKFTPAQLRDLVSSKNKQMQMVQEKVKAKEEQEKQAVSGGWFSGLQKAAERKHQEMREAAERRQYWEIIKRDDEIVQVRKELKQMHKTLKAHRLHGNREETRHTFKRQRLERQLITLSEKLAKTQELLTATQFNIHEYAKAMMRASKKWKKQSSNDQELALEAQLCRNMHQMLTIEKQKSKLKKTTKEIKKYLQRCKSWLSDKQAFCEMHTMKLEATGNSMECLYQDFINRQDTLIKRLKAMDEFKDVDIDKVIADNPDNKITSFDHLPKKSGSAATLCALRGVPYVEPPKIEVAKLAAAPQALPANKKENNNINDTTTTTTNGRPELYITATDDISVNSNLSDPDEPEVASNSSDLAFGNDAPWNKSDSNVGNSSSDSVRKRPAVKQVVETTMEKKSENPEELTTETEPTDSTA